MAIVEDLPDEVGSSTATASASHSTSTRQRKRKEEDLNIPLAHPSTLPKPDAPPLLNPDELDESVDPSRPSSPTQSEVDELLRTGRLQASGLGEVEERERDLWDEVFDMVILTIPFSFLFLLLDILVHLQYSFRPKTPDLIAHMLRAVPTLGIITWFTNAYSSHRATVALLMAASTLCGGRMIYLVNKESWGIVLAQAPAMGTVWTLTIVQLPLSRAMICLVLVGIWAWWTGMKLQP